MSVHIFKSIRALVGPLGLIHVNLYLTDKETEIQLLRSCSKLESWLRGLCQFLVPGAHNIKKL